MNPADLLILALIVGAVIMIVRARLKKPSRQEELEHHDPAHAAKPSEVEPVAVKPLRHNQVTEPILPRHDPPSAHPKPEDKEMHDPLTREKLVDPVNLLINHPKKGHVAIRVNRSTARLYQKKGPSAFRQERRYYDTPYSCYIYIDDRPVVMPMIDFYADFCYNGAIHDIGVVQGHGGTFGGAGATYQWENPVEAAPAEATTVADQTTESAASPFQPDVTTEVIGMAVQQEVLTEIASHHGHSHAADPLFGIPDVPAQAPPAENSWPTHHETNCAPTDCAASDCHAPAVSTNCDAPAAVESNCNCNCDCNCDCNCSSDCGGGAD